MLSVEGRGLAGVETTSRRIFGIVEPEPYVEGVSRRQAKGGIETEDLVQQDGLDGDIHIAVAVGLEVGLIPGQAEVGAIGIGLTVGQKVGVLDGEQVESQVGLQMLG